MYSCTICGEVLAPHLGYCYGAHIGCVRKMIDKFGYVTVQYKQEGRNDDV